MKDIINTHNSSTTEQCPSCGWFKPVGNKCVNYGCATNNPSTRFQLTVNDPQRIVYLSDMQLEALADMIAERLNR